MERAMTRPSERARDRDASARQGRASKTLLSERRAQILADTAKNLLAGKDPDREVLPALYRTLAAERIIDASLGFIVTEQQATTMTLGFIEGFPEDVVQRCLTLDFGRAICGTVAQTRQPTRPTSRRISIRSPISFATPE